MGGIYDPRFTRKPFEPHWRAGEIPGSLVLGKTGVKGCVWPGAGGKWFAARPSHDPSEPYPSFLTQADASEFILAPYRRVHEEKEDTRERRWLDAAPKRAARAERSIERENKKLSRKHRRGECIWAVINDQDVEIGRIVRKTEMEALVGAASLLGFSRLPCGYNVVRVVEG